MKNRIKKMLVAIAAIGALAFGGSAIAQAGNGSGQTTATPAAQPAESSAQSSATDTAEKGEAAGSEVPGDDGPGGHADEPGNPNADHQFQGKE